MVDERRPDSRVSVMTAVTAVTFPSCSSAGGVFEISLKLLATRSVSVVVVVLIGPEGVSLTSVSNFTFLDLLRLHRSTNSPVLHDPVSYSESELLSLL